MNLSDLISTPEKDVVTYKVHNARGSVTMLTIRKDKVLKEHQSTSEALLLLVSGDAVYEEADRREHLAVPMDFVRIPPRLTHKVSAVEDSVLLLIH